MINRFFGLWHHTIIGSDNDDNDIRRLCTARTHGTKGGVTWGIKESDNTAIGFHMVSTDMLGNTARFTGSNFRCADFIE